jgi:peroxiredoxin
MKTWKVGVATLAVVLVCGSAATAQIADDAAAVLNESAKGIQQLKGIHYKSKKYGVGALAALIDGDGEVKQIRAGGDPKRSPIWAKGQVAEPGKGKAQFEVSTDGKTISWLDAPANVLFKRPFVDRTDQQRFLSRGQQLAILEFTEAAPFAKDLKAEKLEMAGATEVHGEACQVVRASWNNGERSTTWYIAVVDHLPRKIEQAFGGGKEPLAQGTEIWDVKTNELKATELAIPLPNGFKLDEQNEQVKPQPDAANPPVDQPIPEKPSPLLSPDSAAPDFEARDSNDQTVKLSAAKGSVVVLSFWGTMFPKSDLTNKVAQEVYETYKDKGVKVYGLACRESSPKDAADHAKEQKLTFPIVPQADQISASYKVVGFPSLCVINRDGRIVQSFQGTVTKDEVVKAVDAAINGTKLETKKDEPKKEEPKKAPPAPAPVPVKK